MATILRLPDPRSAGVLVLTTQERDRFVLPDPAVRARLEALKGRWLVGLHHNWHDHAFRYDPVFDFSMAGEDDLVEVTGAAVPLLTMDACNFVPSFFRPSEGERFWDFLYIARAVFFKRLPEFLAAVRALYDAGRDHRVLCVAPMPPYDPADEATVVYDLRERYERMFSKAERERFTLLTLDFGYPFPLDLETIAFLYRSSKVFAHFAEDERRCRVAAYAWASGLPVVGTAPIASLLPEPLRRPPYLFEVARDADYPGALEAALAAAAEQPRGDAAVRDLFCETATVADLDGRLAELALGRGLPYRRGALLDANLGIRLGRHHGLPRSPNTIPIPMAALLDALADDVSLAAAVPPGADDPERLLETRIPDRVGAPEVDQAPPTTASLLARLGRRLAS